MNETALKLKAIAAIAEVMALKIERQQTWPGDVTEAVAQISKLLSEIQERP